MMQPQMLKNLQQLIIENHSQKLDNAGKKLLATGPKLDVRRLEKWSLSEDDRSSWLGNRPNYIGLEPHQRTLYSGRGKRRWLSMQSKNYFEKQREHAETSEHSLVGTAQSFSSHTNSVR